MEAHTRSPRELFEGKEHYEIPAFQRPYVWNEEDQWAPLWDDVKRVSETYVAAKESDPDGEVALSTSSGPWCMSPRSHSRGTSHATM